MLKYYSIKSMYLKPGMDLIVDEYTSSLTHFPVPFTDALSMQPGKPKDQGKDNAATDNTCQEIGEPAIVPGIFPCEITNDECQ